MRLFAGAQELIQALGTVASAGIGMYVLVSEKTHDVHGKLTKAGTAAFIGLIVSFVVSISVQVLGAKADANKHEELLRASWYPALSTSNAQVELSFWIPIDALRHIAPTYADMLNRTYEWPNQPGCVVSEWPVGIQTAREIDCEGYTFEDDALTRASLSFGAESKLSPFRDDTGLAAKLADSQGFALHVEDPQGRDGKTSHVRRSDAAIIRIGQFSSDARFRYEGDGLAVTVRDKSMPTDILSSLMFTSLVDLLGKKLILDPSLRLSNCSDMTQTDSQCLALKDILAKGETFQRFAVKFPYRRALVFDANSSTPYVTAEQRANPPRKVFVCAVPEHVEDLLPIASK